MSCMIEIAPMRNVVLPVPFAGGAARQADR